MVNKRHLIILLFLFILISCLSNTKNRKVIYNKSEESSKYKFVEHVITKIIPQMATSNDLYIRVKQSGEIYYFIVKDIYSKKIDKTKSQQEIIHDVAKKISKEELYSLLREIKTKKDIIIYFCAEDDTKFKYIKDIFEEIDYLNLRERTRIRNCKW